MKLMVNRKMIDESPVGNKIVNDGDGRLGVEKLQLEGPEPGERVCVGLVVAASPRPGLPRPRPRPTQPRDVIIKLASH